MPGTKDTPKVPVKPKNWLRFRKSKKGRTSIRAEGVYAPKDYRHEDSS